MLLWVFLLNGIVKPKAAKLTPLLVAAAVVCVFCLIETVHRLAPGISFFQRLEWITYDWRMRSAATRERPAAPNLGAVFIDDDNIRYFNTNENYGYSFPWPRHVHGWLVEELEREGAAGIAFDVLFTELHPRDPKTNIRVPGGQIFSSDEFFAEQLKRSRGSILACAGETLDSEWRAVMPADLFRTNAAFLGHITSEADSDGVLRRALPYRDDPEQGRIWHLGIVLAARAMGFDLENAAVTRDRITLNGKNGLTRSIPLQSDGSFLINWSLAWNDERIALASYEEVVEGRSGVDWRDKLVVVGSIGSGNNISDVGATPVSKTTYLVSKHWNIVNSILTGQFIERSGFAVTIILIILCAVLGAVLTLKERVFLSIAAVLVSVAVYIGVCWFLFVQSLYWLPMVLPLSALLTSHVGLVTCRLVFEQSEKRRVRAVFSRIVSPDVVNELLNAEKLSLGGARREITIFFADVRGFTEMTDSVQARAEEYIRNNQLSPEEAEAYYDKVARESLETVNLYLATIADIIKKYNGTLDKYIGDCVMAFWGAPTANKQHALCAVRAAIEAQRAIYQLNVERFNENNRRKEENKVLEAEGKPPRELLPLLTLGTGINSGAATVGLMGSDAHILNYTVFGREVNLASRLESLSGRSRIIIGESTFLEIQRDDPELAATCILQPAVTVKGIRGNLKVYEVPWKQQAPAATPAAKPADERPATSKA